LSDHVPILRHLLLSLVPPTAPPDISTLSLHDALPISLYAERSRPRFRWRTASREIRGFCRCRGSSGTAPWIASSRQRRHSLPKRSEEHTSELQSLAYLVCRLLLEKKKQKKRSQYRPVR